MELKKMDEVMAQDEQPVTVTIFQKDGEPYRAADGSEATMSFLGNESKKVRQAKANNQRKFIRALRSGRDGELDNSERVSVVFAALTGWHGWENGGTPAEVTLENVKTVCEPEHILEQAERAIRAHADFFKANSRS